MQSNFRVFNLTSMGECTLNGGGFVKFTSVALCGMLPIALTYVRFLVLCQTTFCRGVSNEH